VAINTDSTSSSLLASNAADAARTAVARGASVALAGAGLDVGVASATVSFSGQALDALASAGATVAAAAVDAIEWPYDMACSAVDGVVDAVEAVGSGVATAAHAVVIDVPSAILSGIAGAADAANSAWDDGTAFIGRGVVQAGVGAGRLVNAVL
jgi:hypothetical protein